MDPVLKVCRSLLVCKLVVGLSRYELDVGVKSLEWGWFYKLDVVSLSDDAA
jgi:hypothetical protein